MKNILYFTTFEPALRIFVWQSISDLDCIMGVLADEWEMMAEYKTKKYDLGHINISALRSCVNFIKFPKVPSDKEMKKALEIWRLTY
jgi:hypothetical protein